jgi:virginiamycin B lyase
MQSNRLSHASLAAAALTFTLAALSPAHAATILRGTITSVEDGAMEGVVVSARKDGASIRISVVTDAQGHYAFPEGRLDAGHYTIGVRATGYDLQGHDDVDLPADKTTTNDIKLYKTKGIAAQLSNMEWMSSAPDSPLKKQLINCAGCHTHERIFRSKYTSEDFVSLIPRMNGYAPMSMPNHPQLPPAERIRTSGARGDAVKKLADYLASINLSEGSNWSFPLKAAPRQTGRATRVVITEYDLPHKDTSEPHDVIVDGEGTVWYSLFGESFLGKLDPKTGKVTEFPTPVLKPNSPTGALDLEADRDGNLWIAMMYQGAVGKFDKKTETLQVFQVPPEFNTDRTQQTMVVPDQSHVNGKVWFGDVGSRRVFRLDVASGKVEQLDPFKKEKKGESHTTYGLAADEQNNLWFLDYGNRNIGKIDTATGEPTLYPTPTAGSRPRRGHISADGRIAFGEFAADKVGIFDTKSETFQEWPSLPNFAPYDAVLDKNGELWSGSMNSDLIMRLDPKTGAMTYYPLPRETNVRRVFVDNSTSPVTFWIGNNHAGSIVKVEPLD